MALIKDNNEMIIIVSSIVIGGAILYRLIYSDKNASRGVPHKDCKEW
jgi:hypothetical protein